MTKEELLITSEKIGSILEKPEKYVQRRGNSTCNLAFVPGSEIQSHSGSVLLLLATCSLTCMQEFLGGWCFLLLCW